MARDEQIAAPRAGRYSVTWDNYYDFDAVNHIQSIKDNWALENSICTVK